MIDERKIKTALQQALGFPSHDEVQASRSQVEAWYASTAPLLRWAATPSPLGDVYIAVSERGLVALEFGIPEQQFLGGLDVQARLLHDPEHLTSYLEEITEYFAGRRARFDLPVDWTRMPPFQQEVLRQTSAIPQGQVWTYAQVAQSIGRPKAARAVGTALARNPVPIIIPCHRVIGSDGAMHGYGGHGGIETKRWLLRFEGAL